MTNFAQIWKPVVKGGKFPAHYFRARHVSRQSKYVKDVNDAFTKAAKECATGNFTRDGTFQQCIAEKMKAQTFGHSTSYEGLIAHRKKKDEEFKAKMG